MAKSGILLVAYGLNTKIAEQNFSEFCKIAKENFLPLGFRHAFTSELSRDRLAQKGKKTDSVSKAIEKMIFENYSHIYIQSLHLISGFEYRDLLRVVKSMMKKHKVNIYVAKPLLQDENLFEKVVKTLASNLDNKKNSALVYMAHGTRKPSFDKEHYDYNKLLSSSYTLKKLKDLSADALYVRLAYALQMHNQKIYLACMKGSLTIETLIASLKEREIEQISLYPFLSLVGSHTTEDMAGEDKNSWNSQLNAAGFQCTSHCTSLLQNKDFAKLWLISLQNLVDLNSNIS